MTTTATLVTDLVFVLITALTGWSLLELARRKCGTRDLRVAYGDDGRFMLGALALAFGGPTIDALQRIAGFSFIDGQELTFLTGAITGLLAVVTFLKFFRLPSTR